MATVNAFGNYLLDKGFDVTGALAQYVFVKGDGAGGVTAITSASDRPVGVTMFHVTAAEILKGKGASVRSHGIAEVQITGTALLGQLAGLNADGTVRVAVSGDIVVGEFASDGASGGRAAVSVNLPGYVLP